MLTFSFLMTREAKGLVGEMDFSFHTVSTSQSSEAASVVDPTKSSNVSLRDKND